MRQCPVCHAADITLKKHVDKFPIWSCNACGLFWVPDVSDADLQGFYENHYFAGTHDYGYADYVAAERVLRTNARQILGRIAGQTEPIGSEGRRLLDVGCAHGFLVDEASKCGFEAEGIDCSVEATRYARDVLGQKVFLGNLAAAHFPDEYFDAVTSIGSIEHFNDPINVVEEVARVSKKGATFVVTTLDTNFLMGLFRFKPPEHLYYFSRRNLSMLLDAKGFDVKSIGIYRASHVLGEVVGLLTKVLLGAWIDLDPVLARLPGRNLTVNLPNNEMIVIARKR
jgi:ubiquinone/menaquinone biosynthesis C-methylase UbiE